MPSDLFGDSPIPAWLVKPATVKPAQKIGRARAKAPAKAPIRPAWATYSEEERASILRVRARQAEEFAAWARAELLRWKAKLSPEQWQKMRDEVTARVRQLRGEQP